MLMGPGRVACPMLVALRVWRGDRADGTGPCCVSRAPADVGYSSESPMVVLARCLNMSLFFFVFI